MADYVTAIRTVDGPKQIDYNALANLPSDMKPKKHVSTHAIGGSDPLWTATTSKAGFMSATDKSKLDAVNLDKIEAINKLNSHVWQRRTKETILNTSDAETKSFKVGTYTFHSGGEYNGQTYPAGVTLSPASQTIYYSDSYSSVINSSDILTFALSNPTSITLIAPQDGVSGDPTIFDVVKGKYWYTSSSASSVIYYTPANAANAVFTGPSTPVGSFLTGDAIYSISAQTLTGQLNVGAWELVYSDSSTTYPHSGIKNGYEYIYHGGLESRLTSSACETGYYIGTGTVGVNGKSSLTFSFVPRYVTIYYTWGQIERTYTFMYPLETYSFNNENIVYFLKLNCSWDNKTLTWWVEHSDAQAVDQANQTGVKYHYVAWG